MHAAAAFGAVAVNIQLVTGNRVIGLLAEGLLVCLQRTVLNRQNFFAAEADKIVPVGHLVHFVQGSVVARDAEPHDDFFLCQKVQCPVYGRQID